MRWNLRASYLDLPPILATCQAPGAVPSPRLEVFNQRLAEDLGLGTLEPSDLAFLGGNAVPPGARPFAQAYAGHQFGQFTNLGDGRALVLGELTTPEGRLVDVQLKGSGPTPYSRRGDGRAALGPMLREYLVSEAMAALGVPTTRSLAVVSTAETVWREGPRPGAVLTRIAASHLRVGTFEFAAATGDAEVLQGLVDYTVARHYPQAALAPVPALALLEAVVAAQAELVARWMALGFVHGVMNTDNVALSGETLDYGPCAFLDTYRPGQVFSSIDRQGRYAYHNQPGITQWNLTRFAEALLPLVDPDASKSVALAQKVIDGFAPRYETAFLGAWAPKLGLSSVGPEDRPLVEGLLAWMEASEADLTLTFRALTETLALPSGPAELRRDPEFDRWYGQWQDRLAQNSDPSATAATARMAASNPVYIPRNRHLEAALVAAEAGDLGPFRTLLDRVTQPFETRSGAEDLAGPGLGTEPVVTFCGT